MRVRTTGIISYRFPYQTSNSNNQDIGKKFMISIMDNGGERNERKKWIHSFSSIDAVFYVSALSHYCEMLFEEESKNAMWESLDCFHDLLQGKWFRRTPIFIFLNKEDIFRKCVFDGYKLSDCFDADPKKHPNAEWHGAYEDFAKYSDIEWNSLARFEQTDGKTSQEMADIYFENVIHTQIKFITGLFFHIAQHHGKIPNETVFSHVTTALDKDNVKKEFDIAIQNVLKSLVYVYLYNMNTCSQFMIL